MIFFLINWMLQFLTPETVGGKRKCLKQTAATPKKKKTELTNDDSYCEIIDRRDACAPLFDHNSNSIDIKLEDEELVEDRKANFEKASLIKQQLLEKQQQQKLLQQKQQLQLLLLLYNCLYNCYNF